MSSKGWFNLEAVGGTIPETQFFEGDSAFSSLGLTRTQRLYGFAARYVVVVLPSFVMSGFFSPYQLFWNSFTVLFVRSSKTSYLTNDSLCCSYIVGMVLSILGTVMLIIGGLASFAGASSMSFFLRVWFEILTLYPASSFPLTTIVLYGLGTVVSLIGTGFLIGVRLNYSFSPREHDSEQNSYVQNETVPQTVETSKLPCVLTSHSVVHHPSHPFSLSRIVIRCSSPFALSRRSYSWL
jgi:hypothetical protein